jgi:proteic killer suppression protein
MIQSFSHKGLKALYISGGSKGVLQKHVTRLRIILARLEVSEGPADMNLPGLDLHKLSGNYKEYYSVSVSGNWRVIFKFEGKHVIDVNYLDYH